MFPTKMRNIENILSKNTPKQHGRNNGDPRCHAIFRNKKMLQQSGTPKNPIPLPGFVVLEEFDECFVGSCAMFSSLFFPILAMIQVDTSWT